jgi:hypothetical protein
MFPEQARLNDAVRRWVRQERVEERGGVLSVYHLVPRTAAGSYARAVSRAFADTAVVVTGPFPRFAFADPFERGASRRPSRSRRLAAPTHV